MGDIRCEPARGIVVTSMDTPESTYRDMVESQQDLMAKFSPEGRLLFVNSAYCAALGKTREELVGSVFMPVSSERYSDVIATQMTKLFRPPFACIVEQWIQTPRGMRCISWSAKSMLDGNNGVTAIVATGRDITRIKNEQNLLRKKDEELMLAIESGNQLFFSHTPDHILMYVSPRIRTLLGCRPRGGKRAWTEYLTDNPINAAGLERTIRAVASGRREPPYRLEMTARDGRAIWVEVNEIPVVKNGKTVSIVGSLVDITEKKLVEEGLAEAEFLIKDFSESKKRISGYRDPGVSKPQGPLACFRSLFSRQSSENEVDEDSFEIPEALK